MDGFEVFDIAILETEVLFDVLEFKKLLGFVVVDLLSEGALFDSCLFCRGFLHRGSFFLCFCHSYLTSLM